MTKQMGRYLEKLVHAQIGVCCVTITTGITINLYEAAFVFCAATATVMFIGLLCDIFATWLCIRRLDRLCGKNGYRGGRIETFEGKKVVYQDFDSIFYEDDNQGH